MQIEVGITHQIKIDGQPSWVKLGVTNEVSDNADLAEEIDVLSDLVNEKLLTVIEQTVNTVTNYTKDI